MDNCYAGAFIGTWVGDEYFVTCVSDAKYPKDLKMPGGMSEKIPNGDDGEQWETPEQCMVREVNHETGVQVHEAILVHEEMTGRHNRHFFLATRVSGLMTPGTTRKFSEKKKGENQPEEEVTAYLVPLSEFVQRLFYKQAFAFTKILAELAKDAKFFSKYEGLVNKFVPSENE